MKSLLILCLSLGLNLIGSMAHAQSAQPEERGQNL